MKKGTILFTTIICLLVLIVFLYNKPEQEKIINFTSSESYGITSDGTFFIHQDLVSGFKNLVVVVLPKNTAHSDSTVYETGEKNVYRMVKVGDYFLAKPKEKLTKPFYYFKSGVICFPTFETEQFSANDLVKNQCEGYLLKGR